MFITAKHVQINKLPERCLAREQLEKLGVHGEIKIWVVAVPGSNDDWAAYTGHPSLKDVEGTLGESMFIEYAPVRLDTPEGIMRNGDKLSMEFAQEIFPEFVDLRYRR